MGAPSTRDSDGRLTKTQAPRDDHRDRERGGDRGGDRRRRRSRSPRHSSRRDYEVDTYSSSRDYREREREDTYARRERRVIMCERSNQLKSRIGDRSYSRVQFRIIRTASKACTALRTPMYREQ